MRVVAGTARGRRLTSPTGRSVRPTSDRVREALFSMLASRADLEGLTVLDLFAGTGALGIEALSRGAAHATFVERDPAAVATVRANLVATGLGAAATVVRDDARRFVGRPGAAFDVAFCDPPYDYAGWPELLERLPARLAVVESDRDIDPGPGWAVLRSRRYGGTVVLLLARADPGAGPSSAER